MELELIQTLDEKYTGCFIFLHGATKNGKFQKEMFINYLGEKANFKHIKVIFPTSPVRYSSSRKKITNMWFNGESGVKIVPDCLLTDLNEAAESLRDIIKHEQMNGIPLNRIVLGGISQGGMLALHAVYCMYPEVAGCIAVSSFVLHENVYEAIQSRHKNPPACMYHGTEDELVPISQGRESYQRLSKSGITVQFHEFPGAPHELTAEELEHIYDCVRLLIPNRE